MTVKSLLRAFPLLIVAIVFAPAAPAQPALDAQTSNARGVTIKVTPKSLAAGAAAWEFAVVFDTHSGSLDDDLVKSAVLLDGSGARQAPLGWQGAPPGGHHREGVLRFRPLAPPPAAIELQIARAGEPAPRSFRWRLR